MATEATFAIRDIPIAGFDQRMRRPISGDETIREYGRAGRRVAGPKLWLLVRPACKTAGIERGVKIRTADGFGVVTRVGTIAGFYEINGREERWDIESVYEIIVPEKEVMPV